eukprot:TRINITY_DN11695_c0_g1_i2.p1 TRINITY_DN11695_c0_g1~~TRINITY_DN11695_c0_g1_i2.p1  ORF type:complete len:505 (+),score=152.55 TRINITY_DN11695_c0_g1_i2:1-1515(+)
MASSPVTPTSAYNRIRARFIEDNEVQMLSSSQHQAQQKRRKVDDSSLCMSNSYTTKSLTEPEEFHFYTDSRSRSDSTAHPPRSPFVSMSERVRDFQSKTPKRFRTKPRNTRFVAPENNEQHELTVPKPVSFHTEARSRPNTTLTTEERELLEMQQMPKFVAQPVNYKVLHSSGDLGLSRMPKPPLTEQAEFHLQTDERARRHPRHVEAEAMFQFHARELDQSIMHGPVRGVPPLPDKTLTIPESPALATKSRAKFHGTSSTSSIDSANETFVFKAHPAPISKPFIPSLPPPTLTIPAPFHLATEDRGFHAQLKQEERILVEEENMVRSRVFRAQPMLVSAPYEPGVSPAPPTIPEPFELHSDARGRFHEEFMRQKIETEQAEAHRMAEFKAKPFVPVTEFFEPGKSTKPLTVLSDVVLNSDARSARRAEFDQQRLEKEKQVEVIRQQREAAGKTEEQIAIKEMRRKMVHKALPVMQSKPFQVSMSQAKLTQPKTPRIVKLLPDP